MIPFYRPYLDRSELLAVFRPGPGRNEFESALAARVGARYGVAFAYGRSAIMAASKALGISGADVIMPAYTCVVVAEAVVMSDNRPVFVDINPVDYNMDVQALKEALTPQARAIIATHLYGYPADVEAIRAATGDDRVIIIEDCASGLLTFSPGASELRGDIGIFSFGPAKPLYTVQGGVAVTNSFDLYNRLKTYRERKMCQLPTIVRAKRWARLFASYVAFNESVYGLLQRARLTGAQKRTQGETDSLPEETPSDYASAYTDFQARVGLAQLDKLDAVLAKRRALTELYDRELQGVPGLSPAPIIAGATYSYYTLQVERRDEIGFRNRMLAKGVAVDQAYDYAIPLLELYRPYARGKYPRAEQAARRAVNLPNYPGLSEAKARYIAKCVRHSVMPNPKMERVIE
jgi:perosamine synthetase